MTKQLTTAERRAIAVQLGHGLVTVEPTRGGGRMRIECSCGWGARLKDGKDTVTCATEVAAASRAVHHVKTAVDRYVAEHRRAGVAFGVSHLVDAGGL